MRSGIYTFVVALATVHFSVGLANAQDAEKRKDNPLHPRLKMETSLGDIVLELDAEKAPISTVNFIKYTEEKFYDGTIFHRVIKTFMIQGGGFTPDGTQKTEGLREPIKNEWENGLKNKRGTIAMARIGGQPDSATSQFFINVVDNPNLDRPADGAAYTVFGKVVEGMDVVDKIKEVPVSTNPKFGRAATVPVDPVIIKSVRLVSDFDRDKAKARVEEIRREEKVAAKKKEEAFARRLEEAREKGVRTETGLIVFDEEVGDGPAPPPEATVEVHYTGWLTDGTKFDSSRDRGQPFAFSLSGGVIEGWLEGVSTMKVGSKRILIIPPELGYGSQGAGSAIPPDATLVFEVELLGIR